MGSRNPGKERLHAKGYSIELYRQGNNTVGRDVSYESAVKDGFSGNSARGRVTDSRLNRGYAPGQLIEQLLMSVWRGALITEIDIDA